MPGHDSQMQLWLQDTGQISGFPGGNFCCKDYTFGPGVRLSKLFKHFSTNQIWQCKQLHMHLLKYIGSGLLGIITSLFLLVSAISEFCLTLFTWLQHRVCWVHLKHGKRDFILHIIKQPDVFFPPPVKDTELLIFLHHPELSSSSYNNSQYTSNAFTVLQVFRHPPPRQVNALHSGLANSVREQIYLLKASWQKCQKQTNKQIMREESGWEEKPRQSIHFMLFYPKPYHFVPNSEPIVLIANEFCCRKQHL